MLLVYSAMMGQEVRMRGGEWMFWSSSDSVGMGGVGVEGERREEGRREEDEKWVMSPVVHCVKEDLTAFTMVVAKRSPRIPRKSRPIRPNELAQYVS